VRYDNKNIAIKFYFYYNYFNSWIFDFKNKKIKAENMNDYTYFSMIGRVTKDCELKLTSTGLSVATFSIASNKKYKEKESVSFFEFTLFGIYGETMQKYINKGTLILVIGEIEQQKWQDKVTGVEKSKIGFIAKSVQLLSKAIQNNNEDVYDNPYAS
jgi:single-strand DNA-binding protein